MAGFNMLDYLLLLIILVCAAWGALQGVARLLIGVFSLYIALVVSLLLYLPFARFLRDLVHAFSVVGSQALAFAAILFVVFTGLSFLTYFVTTPAEERRRKHKKSLASLGGDTGRSLLRRFVIAPLKTLIGFVIGLIVSSVWISLGLGLLQYVVQSPATVGYYGARLQFQLHMSALTPMFNIVLYLVYRSVSIWLPGGEMPIIFVQIFKP